MGAGYTARKKNSLVGGRKSFVLWKFRVWNAASLPCPLPALRHPCAAHEETATRRGRKKLTLCTSAPTNCSGTAHQSQQRGSFRRTGPCKQFISTQRSETSVRLTMQSAEAKTRIQVCCRNGCSEGKLWITPRWGPESGSLAKKKHRYSLGLSLLEASQGSLPYSYME